MKLQKMREEQNRALWALCPDCHGTGDRFGQGYLDCYCQAPEIIAGYERRQKHPDEYRDFVERMRATEAVAA